MDQSKDKHLKNVIDEFSKGVEAFNKRQYEEAAGIFDRIVSKHEDSGHYNLEEIRARAKVYINLCQSQLNPVTIELEADEDYLFDGIYRLNTGDLEAAGERFEYLGKKSYDDPYLEYLLALLYLKKEEPEACLEHLGAAINKDSVYKVIAYNEPDFSPFFENEDFVKLIAH